MVKELTGRIGTRTTLGSGAFRGVLNSIRRSVSFLDKQIIPFDVHKGFLVHGLCVPIFG